MDPIVKKYRTYAIVGNILAVISLFIGGALLAMLGFIMSHTAYRKLKPYLEANPDDRFALATRHLARNAFIFCAVAAALNFFTAATLLPEIMGQMGISGGSATSGAAATATGIF